jgi:DNA-binding CsgD family transcriptional regulator
VPETRVKPRAKAQPRQPKPPGLVLLGGAPLVLPQGRVTAAAWPEFAAAIALEPEPAILPAWIERLERRMGVKDQHRAAIERRAFTAAEGSEAKRRRLLEQSIRASQISAPLRDPAFVARIGKVQAKLAAARAELADPPGLSDKQRRKAAKVAQQRITDLTAELAKISREEADQDKLYGDAKETILLAAERGDDVTAYQAQTADFLRDAYGARVMERVKLGGQWVDRPVMAYSSGLRARKLTGIEHAKDAGYLGASWRDAERLHAIGVDYRMAYEIVEGAASGEGEGGGCAGPKAPQPRVQEAGEKLADFRRELSPRQRRVLDLVCGEDMRLRECARAMAAHAETTQKALCDGLNRAAASRAEAIEERRAAADPLNRLAAAVVKIMGDGKRATPSGRATSSIFNGDPP